MAVLSGLNLPGWEMVMFVVLVLAFLITGTIVTIVIMSRLRWPLKIVLISNEAGKGYGISGRDRARVVSFGDGGEELILLKKRKKLRVGYGKRIGPKQIGFTIAQDGLWYQIDFGDFDKVLREMGLIPTSVNVRMAMASARKGLDERLQQKSWLEKYMYPLMFGMFILALLIMAGTTIYSSKKNIEIARINGATMNASGETQIATQKTLEQVNILIGKLNSNPQFQGSGLLPNG